MSWPFHDLPFLDAGHRDLATRLLAFCDRHPELDVVEEGDPNGATRKVVRDLGSEGLLSLVIPDRTLGEKLDSRSIALAREILAHRSALADCAFAIQGIGSAPISLFADEVLKARYLPALRAGTILPALALSEPQGGSDVAGIRTTARQDGASYVLDGEKTWISNGGVADFYLVVARTGEAPGTKGLGVFVVDTGTQGLTVEQFAVNNAHPVARLQFDGCRIAASQLVGKPGEGFKVAMANLDIFRPTVGASALGMARRAWDEVLAHVRTRQLFGKTLAEMETVQMRLADMSVDLDLATLSVYRATWAADVLGGRQTGHAATAKLAATEAAQRVIDGAVQLFGGYGVKRGMIVERLYRDIRPLRIGEGASDIQRLVIARSLLRN